MPTSLIVEGAASFCNGERSRIVAYRGYKDVPRRRRWRANSESRAFRCSHEGLMHMDVSRGISVGHELVRTQDACEQPIRFLLATA